MDNQVKLCVVPGGRLPERRTSEAVGFDIYLRAVVSPDDMDPKNVNLRRTLFDFKNIPTDPDIARHVFETEGELVYRIDPGESALVSVGFIVEMLFPVFLLIIPRGSTAKQGIVVTNALSPVDPDYRGEPGALLYNSSNKPFDLKRNMRIAQALFLRAEIPEIIQVEAVTDLKSTSRGAGGLGSTGLR